MSAVIAAALFAQLVVVGGDADLCLMKERAGAMPTGAMTVRELVELMARKECVRYLVPSHFLDRRVEVAPAKDWRRAAQSALAKQGISLRTENVQMLTGPPAPTPVSSDELDRAIRCKTPGHCVVERALVDRLLADPESIIAGARVIPAVGGGEIIGFKVYAILPQSLWARLGVANGDTIQTINGFELTSPEKALEAYTRLRSAAQLTVRIVRREQPLTFTYEIR